MKKIVFSLIVIFAVVGGGFWFFRLRPAAASNYQAAFLSNGQVYFGKLSGAGANYVKLDDVYYLLALQATDSAQPRYTLRRLGSELHGPRTSMLINRTHLLFIENLKGDGRVVKAIVEHKAQED